MEKNINAINSFDWYIKEIDNICNKIEKKEPLTLIEMALFDTSGFVLMGLKKLTKYYK